MRKISACGKEALFNIGELKKKKMQVAERDGNKCNMSHSNCGING